MAQLTVRNIDDDFVAELKARVARTGRFAEAEHRNPEEALPSGGNPSFFEKASLSRLKLASESPVTTEIFREDRERDQC